MPGANKRAIRFVRLLLNGGDAIADDNGLFRAADGDRVATLERKEVAMLVAAGVLAGGAERCGAAPEAANWLRRQLGDTDPYAAQHRQEVRTGDGRLINLAESPLARLAVAAAGEHVAFLAPHQVEAGERLRRLVDRAQLRSRVTMSYDGVRMARSSGTSSAPDISDMAADARRALSDIIRALPRDCIDVVLDVCGLEKGLQVIEAERGWPRRSAKLVLRIGLDQLARHFGLDGTAVGRDGRSRGWMDDGARPDMFLD